uniref:Ovule protein n=1 Tax=Echinococcus granulosus TaxID=6210 RepID=A0A068X2N9_ECHGR|nr:hypothetical protein EgrG_002057300 [Echinococcus granulosus]
MPSLNHRHHRSIPTSHQSVHVTTLPPFTPTLLLPKTGLEMTDTHLSYHSTFNATAIATIMNTRAFTMCSPPNQIQVVHTLSHPSFHAHAHLTDFIPPLTIPTSCLVLSPRHHNLQSHTSTPAPITPSPSHPHHQTSVRNTAEFHFCSLSHTHNNLRQYNFM